MSNTTKMVSTVVVVLLAIIIGVMVYYTIANTTALSEQTSGNTSVTHWQNITINLDDYPDSATEVFIVWHNGTQEHDTGGDPWNALPMGTNGTSSQNWTLNSDKTIFLKLTDNTTGAVHGIDAVNITYNSSAAVAKRDNINPMAVTTFGLLPIVVFVMVAAIVMGVVIAFGGGKRRDGGL